MTTIAEAILEVESRFIVHHEVGFAERYTDQRGQGFGTAESRDMETAPNGERYETVVSGGIWQDGPMPMLFHDESTAVQFWLYGVEDYAETVAPREEWSQLHLYWRHKPSFHRASYVALDQAGMLRDRSRLASQLTIDVGVVWSQLRISRLDPDGKGEA